MKKKLFALFLAGVSMVSTMALGAYAVTADNEASAVRVDGELMEFDSYLIQGNNYFKLRDIAYIMNGTALQFEVVWNQEFQAIELVSDQEYTIVGGEMEEKAENDEAPSIVVNQSAIYLDGSEVVMAGYTVGQNNYFKLRDIGQLLGFNVEWDSKNLEVNIFTTDASYDAYYWEQIQIVREEVLIYTNEYRASKGLSPLILEDDISAVAQGHADDMQEKNYFAHTNLDGVTAADRATNAGIKWRGFAENIAKGQSTPYAVVQSWINSEGHERNMTGDYTYLGVGYNPVGKYWVQKFYK